MSNIKEQIMDMSKRVPVSENFVGVLNETNIYGVAERIRLLFEGKTFAIASAQYADGAAPELNLSTGVVFSHQWFDKDPAAVRVFKTETDGVKSAPPWLGWSADGYSWDYLAAPGSTSETDDYRNVQFKFAPNRMTVTCRTPAGAGCLHKYVYTVQK